MKGWHGSGWEVSTLWSCDSGRCDDFLCEEVCVGEKEKSKMSQSQSTEIIYLQSCLHFDLTCVCKSKNERCWESESSRFLMLEK